MTKLVVANWKQKMTLNEVQAWLDAFAKFLEGYSGNSKIIIAPAFPYLFLVWEFARRHENVFVAAQDVSQHEKGAHTGEVGADQLKDFCDYSIIGHSERAEDPETVFEKGTRLLAEGIVPIMCFVNKEAVPEVPNVVLAWEDPENISKNGVFNPKDPKEIEQELAKIKEKARDAKVLYGGSVNGQNASELGKLSQLDGVLVGSASLDPQHFYQIIEAFS